MTRPALFVGGHSDGEVWDIREDQVSYRMLRVPHPLPGPDAVYDRLHGVDGEVQTGAEIYVPAESMLFGRAVLVYVLATMINSPELDEAMARRLVSPVGLRLMGLT